MFRTREEIVTDAFRIHVGRIASLNEPIQEEALREEISQ